VWDAVLRTQKQPATEWRLVAQADHAALAGEMAGKLASPDFPKLEPEVIEAIAVHDDGWKQIDQASRQKNPDRPLSFFEEAPADIFQAWKGSIASATQIAPIAGILVSEHFCRIARDFSRAATTPPEIAQALHSWNGKSPNRKSCGISNREVAKKSAYWLMCFNSSICYRSMYAADQQRMLSFPKGSIKRPFVFIANRINVAWNHLCSNGPLTFQLESSNIHRVSQQQLTKFPSRSSERKAFQGFGA